MLTVRHLVKIYPGPSGGEPVTALRGIDLELGQGMFGLLGPNGAGKSTLMKILAGLLEPTSGQVLLDGEDVLAEPERVWCQLGYLPQDFGFYPHLTGEKMLLHLLRLKGVEAAGGRRRLCAELLERVNLTPAAKQRVSSYSGGMRQRLGVAQAIAGDPRLVIVDEPTAGLDPEERLRFYRLLAELAEDRIVLLSTHLVDDVGVLCPRFAVIRQGRLVSVTSPSEARSVIGGKIFEASVPGADLARLADECRVTRAILVEGRHRVRIYQPDSDTSHLSPSGGTPPGFEPVPPTLEDAYLVMMGEPAWPPAAEMPTATVHRVDAPVNATPVAATAGGA